MKVQVQNLTKSQQLFINKVTKLVDDNLKDQNMSSATLADSCCLCQRHFSRKIKQVTGMDVTHFIRSRRMLKACRLLRKTQLPVGEIAVKCGLESANYFARIFRYQVGMPPTKYRELNKTDK